MPATTPHAVRYQHVFIEKWNAYSCAGDAQAAYDACSQGVSHLARGDFGYQGNCAHYHGSQLDFLTECAAPCMPAAHSAALSATLSGAHSSARNAPPIVCISSSKGAVCELVKTPESIISSLPGMLAPQFARHMGIPYYIGYNPVAACSTGLNALLSAADLLEHNQGERAFCGSVDTSLEPFLLGAYRNLGVLAQQPPQAFSQHHTGFAPAEGAAFMSMNRHHGAWQLRAGVRLADASHVTRCESHDVIQRCLESLWDIVPQPDLIVTHATGTANSDTFEGNALSHGAWAHCPQLNCKPSIGHCLGASGLVELAIGLHAPVQRIWKISLGFGGHLAAVALERSMPT